MIVFVAVAFAGVAELLDEVAVRDPELAVAEGFVAEARAEVVAARLRPNPELAWLGMGRVVGDNAAINGAQHQPQLNWAIPVGGRLVRGVEAAKRGVVAREAERALSLEERLAEAAALWFEGEWAVAEAERLTEVAGTLDELAERAAKRAEAGGEARFDAGRLRLAAGRAQAEARAFAQVPARVGAALRSLVAEALPAFDPSELERPLPAPEGDGGAAALAARARQDEAAAALRAAKVAGVPIPELSAGAYLTRDGDSASWVAGVALSLPIFDRGQGEVARQQARLATANAEASALAARIEARQSAALARVEAARQALASVDEALALAPPEALRSAARSAWAEGRFSVVELLDAETQWAEARAARLQALLDLRLAEIERLAAFGRVGRLRGR